MNHLQDLALSILETAKKNLVNDNYLLPIILCFKENFILPISYTSKNDLTFNKIGKICKEKEITHIIIINDVATRTIDQKNLKYTFDNYSTECPTSYPESLRREAITVQAFEFATKQTFIVMQFYCKNPTITFQELETLNLFKSNTIDQILEGY